MPDALGSLGMNLSRALDRWEKDVALGMITNQPRWGQNNRDKRTVILSITPNILCGE